MGPSTQSDIPLTPEEGRAETQVAVRVRWIMKRETAALAEIEEPNSPDRWTAEKISESIAKPNGIGLVAYNRTGVVGFLIYEIIRESDE